MSGMVEVTTTVRGVSVVLSSQQPSRRGFSSVKNHDLLEIVGLCRGARTWS